LCWPYPQIFAGGFGAQNLWTKRPEGHKQLFAAKKWTEQLLDVHGCLSILSLNIPLAKDYPTAKKQNWHSRGAAVTNSKSNPSMQAIIFGGYAICDGLH
jgi:hypothetical protein